MFEYCKSLENIEALRNWNVSSGINFSYMFFDCQSLKNLNGLVNWNVSHGIDFSYMFSYCTSFQDLNGLQTWNVSNGTDFSFMFAFCELLQNILVSNTLSILRQDMFFNCNEDLKIHWKNHIYTYEDLLAYEEIS